MDVKHTILIVEDKESMADMLRQALEAGGYRVLSASDGRGGIKALREENPDLVLTDLKLPRKNGMEVLAASRAVNPLLPVVIMTAYGSIETAVKAIKEGAFDFITKPFDIDHLLHIIKRAIDNRRLVTENLLLKQEMAARFGMPDIIGNSKKIAEVAQNISKVAPTKTTVLITGESGTGKELFARAIHNLGPTRDYPFVPVNCAAIPAGLIESELFGHERGSFTGAVASKPGKFELADKGTIFLDEIADLTTDLQAKLLRAIQEGEIERVGASKTLKTNVRVIAASNKDIEKAVANNTFREDLYYRLSVFPVKLPPLRERKEDIPLLVDYFIKKHAPQMKAQVTDISPKALSFLDGHTWKGNVRELENTIERAIILCEGNTVTEDHIVLNPIGSHSEKPPMDGPLEEVAREAMRAAERECIQMAMNKAKGNKTRAAKALRVSYKTLLTKIKDMGI